jgi:hypothetical protein
MAEPTPTIRTAEKDGEGPAKRRRRPALSCVECRNRKIRCDRTKPCGACKKSRSTTCTFRPARPGFRDTSRTARSTSFSTSNNPDQRNETRSSPRHVVTSNELDAMANRYVSPGIFGEHDKQRLNLLPTNWLSLDFASHSKTGESALVSRLLGRIASLESERAVAEGRKGDSDSPVRTGSDTATGQFAKSKFYGQSHWMNALEPVSTSPSHEAFRASTNSGVGNIHLAVLSTKVLVTIASTFRTHRTPKSVISYTNTLPV